MSVPRRILARPVLPALRAATAQYSAAVARPSWRAAAAPAPVAVVAAPRALRWYSVKTPEPKSYTFEEVTEQIRANDEIANGGKGDKVIFVGGLPQSPRNKGLDC